MGKADTAGTVPWKHLGLHLNPGTVLRQARLTGQEEAEAKATRLLGTGLELTQQAVCRAYLCRHTASAPMLSLSCANMCPQARLAGREAAEAEAAKLREEVAELAQRLVELKSTEAERINEVNRMCEQMVCFDVYESFSFLV